MERTSSTSPRRSRSVARRPHSASSRRASDFSRRSSAAVLSASAASWATSSRPRLSRKTRRSPGLTSPPKRSAIQPPHSERPGRSGSRLPWSWLRQRTGSA